MLEGKPSPRFPFLRRHFEKIALTAVALTLAGYVLLRMSSGTDLLATEASQILEKTKIEIERPHPDKLSAPLCTDPTSTISVWDTLPPSEDSDDWAQSYCTALVPNLKDGPRGPRRDVRGHDLQRPEFIPWQVSLLWKRIPLPREVQEIPISRYEVDRCSGDEDWIRLAPLDGSSTSYVDETVRPETVVRYRIRIQANEDPSKIPAPLETEPLAIPARFTLRVSGRIRIDSVDSVKIHVTRLEKGGSTRERTVDCRPGQRIGEADFDTGWTLKSILKTQVRCEDEKGRERILVFSGSK